MTRGIKTSEFWVTIAVILLGAVSSVFVDAQWAKVAGILAAALASMGYNVARTGLKNNYQAHQSLRDMSLRDTNDGIKIDNDVLDDILKRGDL